MAPPALNGTRMPKTVINGYHSLLKGFDQSGNVLWSRQMTATIAGYAAFDDGIVFATLDNGLGAFDEHSGTVLWDYVSYATMEASPVVVPSGVYAADSDGNVYAFAVPYATSATTSAVKRR